jgi:CO/xanthine dehydrogenase FAD-binding subunit
VVTEARLVFFGVGTKPVRAREAEAALIGPRGFAEALAAAGRALGV